MVILFVIIGIALIIFGGVLLVKPGIITAVEGAGVKVSAPVGLLVLILGAGAIWYPFSPYGKPAPSARIETAAPTATATSTPIAFTSPDNGAEVNGVFSVDGTAPDLAGDKLWLFVWSENASTPGMVYYPTANTPLDVMNGIWSADVGPLGEPGKEIGAIFRLKLVRANPQCSDELARATPNSSGELVIPKLPSGCTDAAPPLSVKKAS